MPWRSLVSLHREIVVCRRCRRLVEWRETVARVKVARFRDQDYWGRPVPGFGDPQARIVVVGLAPGAHGANRTGRIFTGDRSGDFLFAALYRAGLASQPSSVARDDGLELRDAYVVSAVRCAPPGNAPRPDEIANCARFLDGEIDLLPRARVLLALGARVAVGDRVLLGSYHVSQQNTQTGRLTPAMFDAVLVRAKRAAIEAA
jgi:uracil-DNA glycosylase family 4